MALFTDSFGGITRVTMDVPFLIKKHGVSQYIKHLFTNQFYRFFLIDPKSHLPFALFKSFHDSLDFPHFNVLVFDVGVKLLTVHILICF